MNTRSLRVIGIAATAALLCGLLCTDLPWTPGAANAADDTATRQDSSAQTETTEPTPPTPPTPTGEPADSTGSSETAEPPAETAPAPEANPAPQVDPGPRSAPDAPDAPAAGAEKTAQDEPSAQSTPSTPPSHRIFGDDRFLTSCAVTRTALSLGRPTAERAKTLLVSAGYSYPDSGAAAAAAAARGRPMLLVGKDTLPDCARDIIAAIQPETVHIVGGDGVVSVGVENAIRATAPSATVVRSAGQDRYSTARDLAEEFFDTTPSAHDSLAVLVVNGHAPADVVTAASAAGWMHSPIVSVAPGARELPAETRATIERINPLVAVIIGGEGVVSASLSASVESALHQSATTTKVYRQSGDSRFATSAAVAGGSGMGTAAVANGWDFADAIGAVAYTETLGPVMLTERNCIPARIHDHLANVRGYTVVGGEGVVSEAVASEFLRCRDARSADDDAAFTETAEIVHAIEQAKTEFGSTATE